MRPRRGKEVAEGQIDEDSQSSGAAAERVFGPGAGAQFQSAAPAPARRRARTPGSMNLLFGRDIEAIGHVASKRQRHVDRPASIVGHARTCSTCSSIRGWGGGGTGPVSAAAKCEGEDRHRARPREGRLDPAPFAAPGRPRGGIAEGPPRWSTPEDGGRRQGDARGRRSKQLFHRGLRSRPGDAVKLDRPLGRDGELFAAALNGSLACRAAKLGNACSASRVGLAVSGCWRSSVRMPRPAGQSRVTPHPP